MKKQLGVFCQWLFACAFVIAASVSSAQSTPSYPNKPVRIIVPFAPGGATTATIGLLGDRFSRELGQNFLADYRGGADTIIGSTAAAKAPPDGYSLLAVTTAIIINHWVRQDLQYDVIKDLALITPLTRSESVLLVHPSVPARNLKQFIAFARSNPAKMDVASTSTVHHIFYHGFMELTAVKLAIVNYKGGGPAMSDLLAGNIPAFITNVANAQSYIATGRLKGLAVSGDKRSPASPETPTFAEAGLKNFDPANWLGLYAQSRTPMEILQKLSAAVRKVQSMPEVVSALEKMGLVPYPLTLTQSANLVRTESERFGAIIKKAGIKVETN